MFAFVVRRITQALFVMLIISLVGFSIKNKIGDPVRDMVGERVTPAEREALRDKLGLNDPFVTQYIRFAKMPSKGTWACPFFIKSRPLRSSPPRPRPPSNWFSVRR
jgi:peptide/nickel transport system permease protein